MVELEAGEGGKGLLGSLAGLEMFFFGFLNKLTYTLVGLRDTTEWRKEDNVRIEAMHGCVYIIVGMNIHAGLQSFILCSFPFTCLLTCKVRRTELRLFRMLLTYRLSPFNSLESSRFARKRSSEG